MPFLTAFFYDRVMSKTEQACLRDWRQELLNQVQGVVLEIGAGTGASMEFYPQAVVELVLSEPDRHMRKILQQKIVNQDRHKIRVIDSNAESLDLADESVDYVFSSLVCCSVNNLEICLNEIKRVLRPQGRLVFLEHVAAAPGTSRRRWQNRINPIWKMLMGNCHINRETEQAMEKAGFRIRQIQRESMRKALPLVRPTIRGIAEKSEPSR